MSRWGVERRGGVRAITTMPKTNSRRGRGRGSAVMDDIVLVGESGGRYITKHVAGKQGLVHREVKSKRKSLGLRSLDDNLGQNLELHEECQESRRTAKVMDTRNRGHPLHATPTLDISSDRTIPHLALQVPPSKEGHSNSASNGRRRLSRNTWS